MILGSDRRRVWSSVEQAGHSEQHDEHLSQRGKSCCQPGKFKALDFLFYIYSKSCCVRRVFFM